MNRNEFGKWLGITSVVGTALQVGMVLVGHYNTFVKENVFAAGGMLISLLIGAWLGAKASNKAGAMTGGALVGGDCALVGMAVSVALGDTAMNILAFGTIGSAVAGLIGGIIMFAFAGSKVSPMPA